MFVTSYELNLFLNTTINWTYKLYASQHIDIRAAITAQSFGRECGLGVVKEKSHIRRCGFLSGGKESPKECHVSQYI